jgi:hypothetical protein
MEVPKMATYTIGYNQSSAATYSRGQTFTPNVAGTGSGIPSGVDPVYLTKITVAYNSSDTSQRANKLYLYSSKPSLTDLNNNGTGNIAESTGYSDGSAFGTGTYTRTFTFDNFQLALSTKYYYLFATNQTLRYATNNPYSGGEYYSSMLVALSYDAQFEVEVSSM